MFTFKSAVPVLPVSDTRRLAAFYADKVGFAIAHADDDYAVLERDGIELHLWAATDESWKQRPAGKPADSGAESFLAGTASCRVLVDDIDRLYETLKSAGIVHPNGHLAAKDYGLTEFAILDADNNLVTFFTPTEANNA